MYVRLTYYIKRERKNHDRGRRGFRITLSANRSFSQYRMNHGYYVTGMSAFY